MYYPNRNYIGVSRYIHALAPLLDLPAKTPVAFLRSDVGCGFRANQACCGKNAFSKPFQDGPHPPVAEFTVHMLPLAACVFRSPQTNHLKLSIYLSWLAALACNAVCFVWKVA